MNVVLVAPFLLSPTNSGGTPVQIPLSESVHITMIWSGGVAMTGAHTKGYKKLLYFYSTH